ncbi:MAG: diguanylate cyclase [Candidatus Omnitrophica bacterium]|nr:diguanylate cyclase [Candidatus Omnitrophota bacterium]
MHEEADSARTERLPKPATRPVAITEEMAIDHVMMAHPETAEIFQAFQVDDTLKGGRLLKDLRSSEEIDVDALVLALNQSLSVPGVPVPELLWGSSCDGMMVIDARRHILAINPTLERWIGRPSRDVVGRSGCGVLFACQDLHGEMLWDRADRCPGLRAIRRSKPLASAEYTIRTASGKRLVTNTSYTPIQPTPEGSVWVLVVMRDIRLQKRRERGLLRQAATDPLTRLPNRTVFFTACAEELSQADRHDRALAVAMADLDGFKAYNDAYGHLAGDGALKALVELLQAGLRTMDLVARYGGDEFVLLLPDTDAQAATAVTNRLCEMVAAFPFAHAQGNGSPSPAQPTVPPHAPASARPLTLSIGVALFPGDGRTVEALLAEADHRLFEAKQRGHDRVCGPLSSGERRRWPRVELAAAIIHIRGLAEPTEALWHDGLTKNLGNGGALFTARRWKPMSVGEEIIFSISVPLERQRHFSSPHLTGRGRVVRMIEQTRREETGQQQLDIALAFEGDLAALTVASGDA